jgi:two-component system, LuxR family, response regulator FixJ
MMQNTLKFVAVVDQDSRRRAALCRLLFDEGIHAEPYETVAELEAAVTAYDLVLLHDAEDALTGYLACVRHSGQVVPFAAYHATPDARQALLAGRHGALDYLTWPFDAAALNTMQLTLEPRETAPAARPVRQALASGLLDKLTPREREVLAAVTGGMTNKLIGSALGISPRTVEIHRANAFGKIGARNTSEAVRVALDGCLMD